MDKEYCGLTYDTPAIVKRGHYIITVTEKRGGSLYRVLKARTVKRRDPGAEQRWSLFCEIIARNVTSLQVPEEATVHKLHWYAREKKRQNFEQYMKRRQGEC